MSTGLSTVIVFYTTNQQTEQGITLRDVTAIAVSGGNLTVESRVAVPDFTYSAFHRYEADRWSHFEVHQQGF